MARIIFYSIVGLLIVVAIIMSIFPIAHISNQEKNVSQSLGLIMSLDNAIYRYYNFHGILPHSKNELISDSKRKMQWWIPSSDALRHKVLFKYVKNNNIIILGILKNEFGDSRIIPKSEYIFTIKLLDNQLETQIISIPQQAKKRLIEQGYTKKGKFITHSLISTADNRE